MRTDASTAKQAERRRDICRYCVRLEARLVPQRGGRSRLQAVCIRGAWPLIVDYDHSCVNFSRAPGSDDDLGG